MKNPAFSLPPVEDSVDRLVNEVIDAEAEGNLAAALEIMRVGRTHPGFGARLAATRAAVRTIKHSAPASPDHRPHVHVEVDIIRPYISPRHRRHATATRIVLAAGVVCAGALLAVLQWAVPPSRPGPVSGVVDAISSDTAALTNAYKVASPPAAAPLPLGDTSSYDNDHAVIASYRAKEAAAPIGPGAAPAPAALASSRVSSGLPGQPHPVPFTLLDAQRGNAAVVPADPLAGIYHIDADGVIHLVPPGQPVSDGLLMTPRPRNLPAK